MKNRNKVLMIVAIILSSPKYMVGVGLPKLDVAMNQVISDPRTVHDAAMLSWSYKVRAVCKYLAVPCGIEESPRSPIPAPDQNSSSKLRLDGRKRSPRQLLDAIIAQHPEYQWRLDGGVLNVVPKDRMEYRSWMGPLLKRRVGHVDYDGVPSSKAMLDICIRAGIIDHAISEGAGSLISPVPMTRKITVHLGTLSVREALNAIAAADGKIIWKFVKDPQSSEYRLKIDSWDYSVSGGFSEPW